MRCFLDTEFIEIGDELQLISIGIKSEDGRTFYAVSSEYEYEKADKWVRKFVITPIYEGLVPFELRGVYSISRFHEHYGKSINQIRIDILDFTGYPDYSLGKPEFWGYMCAYDWILVCRLFGNIRQLPAGFPRYCRELASIIDDNNIDIPKNKNKHNALWDAEWAEKTFQHIKNQNRFVERNNQRILVLWGKRYVMEEIENSCWEVTVKTEKIVLNENGQLMCPECQEPIEKFGQTQYNYIQYEWQNKKNIQSPKKASGCYKKLCVDDLTKPTCLKCGGELPWVYGEVVR